MAFLAVNGGKRACNYEWPSWPIWGDEERLGLAGVLESGQWAYGEKVRQFESEFARFQGAKFAVTASSGTTALEAALTAIGIGAGDEVIIPPYTSIATAGAVLRVNAVPVFADIQPWTLCIDPDDVELKVTERTKAIIPVHVAGYICDMDRLRDVARARNLFIVEDACHACGSQWMDRGAGTLGKCGVLSFNAPNNISSAEGGIIVTDDAEVADACRRYTNGGRGKNASWDQHFTLGSNLRITEFQAAILLAQLTRLSAQIAQRQENAVFLTDELREIRGILTVEHDPRITRRSYHTFPFRIDTKLLKVTRDRFVEALAAEGVPVSAGYAAPLYTDPLLGGIAKESECCPTSCPYHNRKLDYSRVSCPVCEQICSDTCWFPHNLLLAKPDAMDIVVKAVAKVSRHAKELR